MVRRFVQPALIGGLVAGTLSALPLVSAGNFCCCLWVVVGGVVAAYFLQQNGDEPITVADGALVGLVAGLVGVVVHLLLSIPISLLVAPMERALLGRLVEPTSGLPPEVRDYLRETMQGSTGLAARIVIGVFQFLVRLFVAPLFSALGGVLGAALFRRTGPPESSAAPITPAL